VQEYQFPIVASQLLLTDQNIEEEEGIIRYQR